MLLDAWALPAASDALRITVCSRPQDGAHARHLHSAAAVTPRVMKESCKYHYCPADCHRANAWCRSATGTLFQGGTIDRKSTRLNSSHSQISYAVFCLKKKKK